MKKEARNTLFIIISAFVFIILMGFILRLIQREFFLQIPTTPYAWGVVSGNNGTTTCQSYCEGVGGGPWNGELPRYWNGAYCQDTIGGGDCNTTKSDLKKERGFLPGLANFPTQCICAQSGTGWSQKSWRER